MSLPRPARLLAPAEPTEESEPLIPTASIGRLDRPLELPEDLRGSPNARWDAHSDNSDPDLGIDHHYSTDLRTTLTGTCNMGVAAPTDA